MVMSSVPAYSAAFIAGLLSFLSPCVLPMVPGYVSLISGSSVGALQTDDKRVSSRVLFSSLMFIAGFTLVFVFLGAVATTLGQLTLQYHTVLRWVAGGIIIVFGLHLLGLLKIKALYADKRFHGIKGDSTPWGAFAVGFAFAFGWMPCTGPILGAILTLAATEATVFHGMRLLSVYALGLAVPFLFTSLLIDRFLVFYGRFRRHLHAVEVVSGMLLIAIGLLFIFSTGFGRLSGYLSFLNRFAL